ncbi:7-cyano-7-deazaguanine synthase [Mucisphaera calidilacus]|uniref:7-cyano-7-deazaguanine synthase n=1 Tax=Mucisphaera calidilacus TaxID=2527982 RepID=A0A518BZX5_9BACT|nr:7-cyano-7-deazaguanine synthase [Mucisphaera calidilacus]QDU72524.1 7-cyano-7-deazaguanine synthase [Mucisphaera calidilacus]
MERAHTIVLCGGGVASLVAATLAQNDAQTATLRMTLLHADDGRENVGLRARHAKVQAQDLASARVHRIEMRHLLERSAALDPNRVPPESLLAPQLLIAAMSHALSYGADRVIWPVSGRGDAEASIAVTNTVLMIDGLARSYTKSPPAIETPLSDLKPEQVVRLGEQLGVDWTHAWSCLRKGRVPCGACQGCARRKASFEAAGLRDPLLAADAVLAV